MIDLPSLFADQEEFRDKLRASLAKNIRIIGCAQAGFGKTRCARWVLGALLNRTPMEGQSGRGLFVVYGRPLVDNASQSFAEVPALPHGILMSGRETHYGRRIQIGSIDTMLSHFIEAGSYSTDITFDLIIYDEADSHHPKFARFLTYHDARRAELGLRPAYVIGLTATPQAKGLSDVYKDIVLGPTTKWLTDNGRLAPFRYFAGAKGRLSLLVKKGDEFTRESEARAFEGMAGDMLRDWKKFAEGLPTVGFFPRRLHAQEAMAELHDAGLRVAYVDGDTPDEERFRLFNDLDRHAIDYLANVRVVGRGSDIPGIQCVQLCVATNSVAAFIQYIGRGSRVKPGKSECRVIDHGNNVHRLGFFDDERHWSLDITTKDPGDVAARPTVECPRCSAIFRGGLCRVCGYEPTPQERKAQGLDFDRGEMKEVTRKEKASSTKSPEELMIAALYKSGHSRRTWKQCVGIYFHLNEEQGTRHRVPRRVTVGGHTYEMVRYGSPDGGRLVGVLYPFTVGRGDHSGPYLVREGKYETASS